MDVRSPCLDALDSNDDGDVNLADPIFELAFLFTGGPAPMAPFLACGDDPTADTIGCAAFDSCP